MQSVSPQRRQSKAACPPSPSTMLMGHLGGGGRGGEGERRERGEEGGSEDKVDKEVREWVREASGERSNVGKELKGAHTHTHTHTHTSYITVYTLLT